MNYHMKCDPKKTRKIVEDVKPAVLIAATKYTDADQLSVLEENGVTIFGENRVQDFLKKRKEYKGHAHWHFIGTLQSNKVKYIIDKVDLIHSISSYSLIDEVEKQASKHDLKIHVLIQVNIAQEESKHGFKKEEMDDVISYIMNKQHIVLEGLMMMAPDIEPSQTRIYFKETRELLESINQKYHLHLSKLSMGMSQDYKIALEEGSTMVRIGHALFKG
ncbi:YggS family pyridoxal phosphate enzyme [Eggerthia catenaformis OT 569 = DSM 20559]|uniref:Pyridoxal phosphate homeostasis protein n=1 Tax=Eggerthia catenaformis OT 569 = DSM 20559 TaxID=999415 RepID=M2Q495_9FIRM|nr:YggS family pyridoxal phosphate-dependent enzyme [Eggerthia catenaformis]EMD17700.1 YggS family pyridoxal phosphate enzyme [Eggerthia catenaformis OT 569 = DSM 20559]